MKKRIVTLIMAAVLVLAMAVPAFAGSVNSAEEKVLTAWNAVVDSWTGVIGGDIAAQYKAEARSAMMNDAVELNDAAATDIINNAINPANAVVQGCATKGELRAKLSQVLGIVNPVVGKYNMTISVDAQGYGYVKVVSSEKGPSTVIGDNKPAVKQTGASMAGTFTAAGLIVAALAVCAIVMSKKRLNER